jgi:hypothetical protein
MAAVRRVLLVNHGYPPLYNAGSEIYTQTLALGLRKRGAEVAVFTREEDPFKPDYRLTRGSDHIDSRCARCRPPQGSRHELLSSRLLAFCALPTVPLSKAPQL